MNSILPLCSLAVLSFLTVPALAQQAAPLPEERVIDLGGGLFAYTGTHNNAFAVGEDGVLLVDTRFARDFEEMIAAISQATPLPVRYLVNTHHHIDHVEGNALFREHGATILAHSNISANLLAPPSPGSLTGEPIPPLPDGLPDVAYDGRLTVDIGNGIIAELLHPGLSHGNDDTIVWFPHQNVIAIGDLGNRTFPNIDIGAGGSVNGLIRATTMIVDMINDETVVVPGHMGLLSRSEMVSFRDMLVTARDIVIAAKASGMTRNQFLASNLLDELKMRWMIDHPVVKKFPERLWDSVQP